MHLQGQTKAYSLKAEVVSLLIWQCLQTSGYNELEKSRLRRKEAPHISPTPTAWKGWKVPGVVWHSHVWDCHLRQDAERCGPQKFHSLLRAPPHPLKRTKSYQQIQATHSWDVVQVACPPNSCLNVHIEPGSPKERRRRKALISNLCICLPKGSVSQPLGHVAEGTFPLKNRRGVYWGGLRCGGM